MLFFLQKPPTNTQNVYMKYISYLKILNIAVHNYYTEPVGGIKKPPEN